MTREETIQRLTDLQDGSGQTYEAIRMAIEALKGGDAEMLNEDFRPKYMQQSRHDDGKMTMEQAAKWVKFVHDVLYEDKDEEIREALNIAIEALSVANIKEEFESVDAEFTDLPDIPRYYYEKVVGKMAHEINMLKEQLESAVPNCKKCAIKELWEETEKEDLVSVVLCKDCRWYENRYGEVCHNPRYGDGHANYSPPYVNEEYFCKDGERREP